LTPPSNQLPLPEPIQKLLERFSPQSLNNPLSVLIGWPWMFYRQMRRDRAFIRAAGMGYATLIALVPLLILLYAILGSMGIVQQNPEAITDFLFGTFLGEIPEVRDTLLPGLRRVNLSTLSITGLVTLVFVSARLFLMVESAYCDIFGTPNTRKLSYRLLNFYFTLTAVPVVLGFTILGTVEFATGNDVSWLSDMTTSLLQFIVLLAAIKLFPCTYVRWIPASTGAFVAWFLLEIGGRGFSAYVRWFATDDPLRLVYGTLGVIPVFLLWLYLLWLFILLGVEVAAVIQNYSSLLEAAVHEGEREQKVLNADNAVEVMGRIAQSFEQDNGPSDASLLRQRTGLSSRDIHFICGVLCAEGLLADTENGWLPGRPPESMTLGEIMSAWTKGTQVRSESTPARDELQDAVHSQLTESLAQASRRWYGTDAT
jgi:membrane protein